ncbi:hypothetical protein D3C86_1665410 [compost metagenome]
MLGVGTTLIFLVCLIALLVVLTAPPAFLFTQLALFRSEVIQRAIDDIECCICTLHLVGFHRSFQFGKCLVQVLAKGGLHRRFASRTDLVQVTLGVSRNENRINTQTFDYIKAFGLKVLGNIFST